MIIMGIELRECERQKGTRYKRAPAGVHVLISSCAHMLIKMLTTKHKGNAQRDTKGGTYDKNIKFI